MISKMMSRLPPHVVFLVMLLFCFKSSNAGEPKIRCREVERQALLKFKEDLHDLKPGFLSSWGHEEAKRECCEWYGIQCANSSGHVTLLDLSPSTDDEDIWQPATRGKISHSLCELKHLTYLHLSFLDFAGHGIPSFIGTLTKLRYLNLSFSEMSGEIPPQLGNLSDLEVLDLSYNYYYLGNNYLPLRMKSMGWVSHLSSLRVLDLSYTNMSQTTDWVQVVNKLPHLTNLQLSECDLPNITSSALSLVNSSASLAILDLSYNWLSASLYQWLFSFSRSLVHLDLSGNVLEGPIPESFWNMTSLEYLSLSSNNFEGQIPETLGNLTELTYLHLSYNNLEGEFPKSLWNLCMLRELYASDNHLSGLLPFELNQSFSCCTCKSLQYLDFSYNRFMGSLPNLSLLSSLKAVSLSGNRFNGTIPETIGQLAQLEYLELGGNSLEGVISEAHFSKLTKLSDLDLSGNRFNGTIPETIGQLSQLEYLFLDGNSLEGVISEAHFSKLTKLSSLGLSDNSLILKFGHQWVPPFQLESISLGSCNLGPQFPRWLQTQKRISWLDISNSRISDSIPEWFWDITARCVSFDLSNNQIHGTINYSFEFTNQPQIDLSSNKLEGSIPPFIFKVGALNLSANRFSSISSICNIQNDSSLSFVDISFNQLSGEIPDCWSPFKSLGVLILTNNKFSGEIPISIGSLTEITALHLSNNYLTAELPLSLKNCTNLMVLGVEGNRLRGSIPTWIGESLSKLVVLSLRSNHFSGAFPSELCHLVHLQLLDLSSNNISGSVPRCLNQFTAMKKSWENGDTSIAHVYSYGGINRTSGSSYQDEVNLVWKGTLSKFSNTLGLVKSIDLSSNKLTGEIPTEITELIQLVFLNLSRNKFSGQIPSEIGRLALLDALDLSNNQLAGRIPSSLAEVARLDVLNLSNNHLSGKIPTGTQLQSFQASSYTGNPELCGAPLLNLCPGDGPTQKQRGDGPTISPSAHEVEDQDKFITPGYYVSLGVGFAVGFWGVCSTLIFSKTWRYSFFNFVDDVNDWIYVMAAVHKAKLLRMFKN